MEQDGIATMREERASGDACQATASLDSVMVSQSLMLMLPDIDVHGDSAMAEKPPPIPTECVSPTTAPQVELRGCDTPLPVTPFDPSQLVNPCDQLSLLAMDSRLLEEQSCVCTEQPGTSSTLSLTSLLPLLSCQTCSSVPITSLTVHTCAEGHQVCGNCFSDGHHMCEICDAPLEGRHEALEVVLQNLRMVYPALFRRRGTKFSQSLHKTLALTSHRPMKCPHLSCNRVVASNGFFAHFEFEHPSVPVFPTTQGQRLSFLLPDRCLYDSRPMVLALLYIAAPSIPTTLQATMTEKMECAVPCVLLACAVYLGTLRVVAAWCASLTLREPPLFFTLQASASRTFRSGLTSFTGSMRCLQDFQDPGRMLESGRCLVLTPGSLAFNPAKLLLTFHLQPCGDIV